MARYLGDYSEDGTLDFKFNTIDSSDAPITLAGTPSLAVYKTDGTTESTAGITLTVDFDSVTGLHHVQIDLSADAFYATGNDYQVVIAAGTVDGNSVVGVVLADFSIENRVSASTAGLATAAALATVDGNVDTLVASILSSTNSDNLIAVVNALLEDGRIDLLINAIKEDTGTTLPAAIAAGAVAGGSGSTLRTEIERLAGIDQATIYGSDELFAVGTGDTSYVTWGKAVYDSDNSKTVVFYTTTDGGLNVIRRIDSTDGKTSLGNRADCVAADDTWNAGGVWVGNVAIIDSTWYMFCAGRTADAATLSVGLYTSADGVTWTASESNPVLSPTLDWQVSSIEPTGLIRVGDTLHMFYTTLPTTSSSVPIYARKIGRASAPVSDLTDWTDHGVVFGDGDDEYDEQPFHGYYSAEPFKNGTNGYYYLIVAKYGPATDYSQFELWECYDISFDKDKRRYVKTIAVTQDVGTFPDREWDIASVLTDDAYKMVDSITATSDEIRIYAGCKDTDTWKQALLLYGDVHELLRPGIPVNHAYDGQLPQTRWAKAGKELEGYNGYSVVEMIGAIAATDAGDPTIDGTSFVFVMPGGSEVTVSGTATSVGDRSGLTWTFTA
jgi:hypothetical protein